MRALLIEKDINRILAIRSSLKVADVEFSVAHTTLDAHESIKQGAFDAIILGPSIANSERNNLLINIRKNLKSKKMRAPILALLRNPPPDLMNSTLMAGANDCLNVPLQLKEIGMRVRANVRKFWGHQTDVIAIGEHLEVDCLNKTVLYGGLPLNITDNQYKMMEFFALRKDGASVSKETIFNLLRAAGAIISELGHIDTYIHSLRQILITASGNRYNYFSTEFNRGVRLIDPEMDNASRARACFTNAAAHPALGRTDAPLKVLMVSNKANISWDFNKRLHRLSVESADSENALSAALNKGPYDAVIIGEDIETSHKCALINELKDCFRNRNLSTSVMAIAGTKDAVTLFKSCVDDCIAPPYTLNDLTTRLHTLVTKPYDQKSHIIIIDDHLSIDISSRMVLKNDEVIQLTPDQYILIEKLAMQRQKDLDAPVSRQALMDEVESQGTNTTLSAQISKINKKLGLAPDGKYYIGPAYGAGYKFRNVLQTTAKSQKSVPEDRPAA